MDKPKRIQLSRKRGWRKPDGVVSVGRGTRWGNPYRIGEMLARDDGTSKPITRDETVWMFRNLLLGLSHLELEDHLAPLRGHDLACWCKPGEPCHADVLLELANEDSR